MQMQATFTRKRKRINLARSLSVQTAQVAQQAKAIAIELTSGSVSTAQLQAMGHPFARRNRQRKARVSLPKLPINVQSGALQKSLRVFSARTGGETAFRVQFTSPHAVVLTPGGTAQMVSRGFWPEMRKRVGPISRRALGRVTKAALQG